MPDISITITGADELVRKLGLFDTLKVVEPAVYSSVLRLEARMKQYPPARVGSRYRRTGTLGRRWTHSVTRSANSIIGRIGNNTAYAPFVQSKRFQRPLFKRIGWVTDEDMLQSEVGNITRDFERAIQGALAKL